jgi:hypothetical protein
MPSHPVSTQRGQQSHGASALAAAVPAQAAPAPAADRPVSASSKKRLDSDQILSESAIRYNDFLLDYCQTSMSALSGSAAGIIGLTGLNGFAFYFICSLVLSFAILLYIGNNTKKYFLSKQNIFTGQLWSGIQTYLLFWTFLYGMVHVY